ncbi:hypothetical protein IIB79_05980 [candidate division KSB1 bacterium]|nr:hypothetical protein [candidate division KSB1 bacterium]
MRFLVLLSGMASVIRGGLFCQNPHESSTFVIGAGKRLGFKTGKEDTNGVF